MFYDYYAEIQGTGSIVN